MKSSNKLLLIFVSVFIVMLCIGPLSANENGTDITALSEDNVDEDIVAVAEEDILTEDENLEISVQPVTKEYSNNNMEYSFKVYDLNTKQPVDGNAFQVIVGYNAGAEFFGSYYGNVVNGIGKVTLDVIPVGTHKVMVEVFLNNGLSETVYSTITINQVKKSDSTVKESNIIKPIVKAPVVKVKQKANKFFKVTVKNGKSPVKNLKLKVKVWTGKKAKTYTIKTNSKGVAKLSTKKLKVGTHKVKVTSGNVKYKISKSSKIVVKKK